MTKLDGRDVRCPDGTNGNEPNNLVDNGPFEATICYQTPNGGNLDQQKADAQKACDSYCASSFGACYPLGSIATPEARSPVSPLSKPTRSRTRSRGSARR